MPTRKQQPARHAAARLLNQFNPQKQNLKDVLPKFLAHADERNVLTDIVFGVIRNRELIDDIIEIVGGLSVKRVQKKLLNIARIGVFELVFTPDKADYAIVDAAVEEAKMTGGKKAAGFVNALLRNVGRHIKNRSVELAAAEVTKTVIQNARMGCEFDIAILADPKANPALYLSKSFSVPLWLVEEWLGEFDFEQTKSACIASNRRPSVYLRPNVLKITSKQLYELLQNNGIGCKSITDREMIKINHPGEVTQIPGFNEGFFTVQDLTASEAVRLLSPQTGWTVVDLCAAPGGKTTQLAELMADKGTIFATDINEKRLKNVEENCKRLDIRSVHTIYFKKMAQVLADIQCDAILLDVPCSNTGVLSRRPEVRYRAKPQVIKELVQTQLQLLNLAAELVKSGGRISYSTCSIQKEENSGVVRQFLTQNSSFTLVKERLFLPSADEIDCDGGYVAILLKK
jgi:16S rRNA (cytosine967-C5)-methyltransferase